MRRIGWLIEIIIAYGFTYVQVHGPFRHHSVSSDFQAVHVGREFWLLR